MMEYLRVEPAAELVFQIIDAQNSVKQTITVANDHNELHLAFKVKTTAPKHFVHLY